jgi:hypothetical protein
VQRLVGDEVDAGDAALPGLLPNTHPESRADGNR